MLNLGGSVIYATVLFYIASEGLSIVENLAQLGVPIPKILAGKLECMESINKRAAEEVKESLTSVGEEKDDKIG